MISVHRFQGEHAIADPLTDLLREGATSLLAEALRIEIAEHLATLKENGRDVVRNGFHLERTISTGIGPVPVQVPRIRSRDDESAIFRSEIVPPYLRRSASIDVALPWLYLKGISTGQMADALSVLVGANAKGFSPQVVSRLKEQWSAEYDRLRHCRLDGDIWGDGIYATPRGDEHKLCILVLIGVNERGEKKILAIEDGVRKSTQSWREVFLGCTGRGMNEPKRAVGDGVLGMWSAGRQVFPGMREQRCWMHKSGNVLNSLPKVIMAKA